MQKKENVSRLFFIVSMLVFSTVGIVRRFIPLPSGFIAMTRGLIGALTLLLLLLLMKKRIDVKGLLKKLPILIITGVLIGGNWILLFESYNYTTLAVATLCYYMAPSFVILASPLVLGERMSPVKLLSLLLSFGGMVLVSGIAESGFSLSGKSLVGMLLGLGAAVLYASVILSNKRIRGVEASTLTVVELFSAGVVLIPYTLLSESVAWESVTPLAILLLAVLGVVHTGIAYAMYFGSLGSLSATTVAVLGYIDPVVALFLSALVLGEPLTPSTLIGAVLILGSTLLTEMKKTTDLHS